MNNLAFDGHAAAAGFNDFYSTAANRINSKFVWRRGDNTNPNGNGNTWPAAYFPGAAGWTAFQ